MLFTSYLEMDRQPLEDLPSPLAFVKNRLEGNLTLESLLFAKGNTKEELLSKASREAQMFFWKRVWSEKATCSSKFLIP
jgi:HSP90 family molecular chaperone